MDNTVLRYRNDIVAGVFHIKNNQLDDEATWYTSNGMILKKGTFSAGARQGNWFFHSYTIAYNVYYVGKILKSEYYGINMNPEDDPNGYNYYDSEGY